MSDCLKLAMPGHDLVLTIKSGSTLPLFKQGGPIEVTLVEKDDQRGVSTVEIREVVEIYNDSVGDVEYSTRPSDHVLRERISSGVTTLHPALAGLLQENLDREASGQ